MKKIVVGIVAIVLIAIWTQALRRVESSRGPTQLPSIVYLGTSGTFTIPPDQEFVVKRLGPFRFDLEFPPSYTVGANERVWQAQGVSEAPPAIYHEPAVIDTVPEGCVVEFLVIDDDLDDRINYFRINGVRFYTEVEGMVTGGQFVVPEAGVLSYEANDSVGGWINYCLQEETPTPTDTATSTPRPTETNTATPTTTPEITATATPDQTNTPTATPDASVTVTATATQTATATATFTTPTPTATPTSTMEPTDTPSTVEPTPTPTSEPRALSCLRINFDVGGDEARAGTYAVHELGGRYLTSWYAEDGWKDSGWIQDIDISYPSVYVEVWFTPVGGGNPLKMVILNPAPDTNLGWLTRGACHALEVAWPEVEIPDDTGGPANTENVVWPDLDSTATPIPSGDLSP